mgnify:CR=1 FL=1
MIEIVNSDNLNDLLELMHEYQLFYQVENIDLNKNQAFFSQFEGGNERGVQFIRRINGEAVAFATMYFSYASTIAEKVGVINDLYTVPANRQKGLAKELINHCKVYAKEHGCFRVQWLTAKDNTIAQAAYNKLAARSSEWVFYALPV